MTKNDIGEWVHISSALAKVWDNLNQQPADSLPQPKRDDSSDEPERDQTPPVETSQSGIGEG